MALPDNEFRGSNFQNRRAGDRRATPRTIGEFFRLLPDRDPGRNHNGLWRRVFPRPYRSRAQSLLFRQVLHPLRRQCPYACLALGRVHHLGSGCWRHGGGFPCKDLRARSAGTWRAGSHGCDLLQGRPHPAGGRDREIACIGAGDRQRIRGWARRADHPDRGLVGIQHRGIDRPSGVAAHHACCGRRRRRHCGDIQHPHWRRSFRDRIDDAGSQYHEPFFPSPCPPEPRHS